MQGKQQRNLTRKTAVRVDANEVAGLHRHGGSNVSRCQCQGETSCVPRLVDWFLGGGSAVVIGMQGPERETSGGRPREDQS